MKSRLLSGLIRRRWISVILLLIVTSSCEKEPGEGGNSIIRGRVYVNSFFLNQQRPAADQDVCIIYGDDDYTVDDRTRTSFDGTYKFEFLRKGKYRVFVYSEDTTATSAGRDTVFLLETEIKKNHSEVELPDLITYKL